VTHGREHLLLTLLVVATVTLVMIVLGAEIASVIHTVERGLAG
jgi:hypothetical protein